MKTTHPLRRSCLSALVFACMLAASTASAGHHEGHGAAAADSEKAAGKTSRPDPSPEARAELAAAHEAMAACLRSTRPMDECRAEMHKLRHPGCSGDQCSMGHHDGHHDAHHDGHHDGKECGKECSHGCGHHCPHHGGAHGKAEQGSDGHACEADDAPDSKKHPTKGPTAPHPAP